MLQTSPQSRKIFHPRTKGAVHTSSLSLIPRQSRTFRQLVVQRLPQVAAEAAIQLNHLHLSHLVNWRPVRTNRRRGWKSWLFKEVKYNSRVRDVALLTPVSTLSTFASSLIFLYAFLARSPLVWAWSRMAALTARISWSAAFFCFRFFLVMWPLTCNQWILNTVLLKNYFYLFRRKIVQVFWFTCLALDGDSCRSLSLVLTPNLTTADNRHKTAKTGQKLSEAQV